MTLLSICLTLTHVSSHTHTLCRDTHARAHTHTSKSCFDQGSAVPLEPHLAGFYGNSRLGRGILGCSTPVMQTDEWTVCSVSPGPKCLSWTGDDSGMWWHDSDSRGNLVQWLHSCKSYFKSRETEQVWVIFPEKMMLCRAGTACWGPEQWLPIISNNKKPPTCLSSYSLSCDATLCLNLLNLHFLPLKYGVWEVARTPLQRAECSGEVETNNRGQRGNFIHCMSNQLQHRRLLFWLQSRNLNNLNWFVPEWKLLL